jgi:phosphate:Na+ symporter
MMEMSLQLIGGVGLFLLGMALLTEGLRVMAGESLRRALVRFTGTPFKAFGSGVLVTLLVQSSSATTVTVIGFVSAGLLTFPQALGVVFGASLGTTGTGWMVALLGLKVKLGIFALPVVALGALLKLFGHGRHSALGTALAGFALIFLGIDFLQGAMQGLGESIRMAHLSSTGFTGHLLALVAGVVLTLILQSSTATMATTLTALHTGAVNFEQAAALAIGAAIGTTATGVLAALGGTVPAKRTALAHVLFNAITGGLALALLPWYLRGIEYAQAHWGLAPGAVSLAAFHTAFIAVGVLLFLPWVGGFARLIEWLLRDRGPHLTRHLDPTLLHTPPVALEALRRALAETACNLFQALRGCLESQRAPETVRQEIAVALADAQQFLACIPVQQGTEDVPLTRLAEMHAIDHLLRLQVRLDLPAGVLERLSEERLRTARQLADEILGMATSGLVGGGSTAWLEELEAKAAALADLRRHERAEILRATAGGEGTPAQSLERLDALHWLDHAGYHAWRICVYLDSLPRDSAEG